MQTNWQRLDDSSWGIKVQDYPRVRVGAGDQVEVTNRAGKHSVVRLGARVASWNGGRAVVFQVAR